MEIRRGARRLNCPDTRVFHKFFPPKPNRLARAPPGIPHDRLERARAGPFGCLFGGPDRDRRPDAAAVFHTT